MRLKIISKPELTKDGYINRRDTTRIVNADTNELLVGVQAVNWHADLQGVRATIEMIDVEVDIEVDAEVKK